MNIIFQIFSLQKVIKLYNYILIGLMTSTQIIFILVEKYKCTYVQHCLNLTIE